MSAPFYKLGMFGSEFSLIVAFVIGIAFGFVLERAGFGSARKLAAQFYLKDMSVLKVMFTAIITAMVGVYVLSRIGFLDLSLIYITPTYLAPQITGGIILGVGFVIGGYCPGTSVVSSATGRLDAMVYVGGMIFGLVVYGEMYPLLADFVRATPMGPVTLPQVFHIPYGVLVLAVVIMALGMFLGAEWIESLFTNKNPVVSPQLFVPSMKLTPVRGLAVLFLVLGLGAAVGGSPYRGQKARVDAKTLALQADSQDTQIEVGSLADWLVKGMVDFQLVDVRDEAAYVQYHIPGALHLPLAELNADMAAHNEKIIFYADSDLQSAQAWFLLKAMGFQSVHILKGGLDAWKNEILFPAKPDAATPEQLAEFKKQVEVCKFFGGQARNAGSGDTTKLPEIKAPAMPAVGAATLPMASRKKRREGC